jgi:putative NADH-flavin reductase
MEKIIIFGAGGRAGRAAVAEARRRGREVTAVVRDPSAYVDLAEPGVTAVAGDATDAASVARLATGHHAVIGAVYRADADAAEFFGAAGRGLADGLALARIDRLVWVGVAATLPIEDGLRMCDGPDFPAEWRAFALAHDAASAALRGSDLDWVIVTPPMRLEEGEREGAYRTGTAVLPGTDRITYADLAIALLDEAEDGKHHREQIAVAGL